MATRSRTLLFVQYRNTYARQPLQGHSRRARPFESMAEDASLLPDSANMGRDGDEVAIEMSALPPKWVDIVDEVEEDISTIKDKIARIESLYKKHLLPGFDDRQGEEQSIERIAQEIISHFNNCQKKIKKINAEGPSSSPSSTTQGRLVGKNIQTSLATKLQDLSTSFRKTQSAYLSKLRGREARGRETFGGELLAAAHDDDEELDSVFTDAQMQAVESNERAISEREREITEIVKSINGLATVFKELNTMVIDQGTILDRIDYNIEQTNVNLESGHEELKKAEKYQSSGATKIIIIVLLLLVLFLTIYLLVKLGTRRRS